MRTTENFNGNWLFRPGFDTTRAGVVQEGETVRLPHSAVELPYNYFDETEYQKPFTYQKVLDWRADFEGREVSLVFDAAMADSVVYLRGDKDVCYTDMMKLLGYIRTAGFKANIVIVPEQGS